MRQSMSQQGVAQLLLRSAKPWKRIGAQEIHALNLNTSVMRAATSSIDAVASITAIRSGSARARSR